MPYAICMSRSSLFVSLAPVTVEHSLFMGGLINGSLQLTPAVEGITTPQVSITPFSGSVKNVCQSKKGRDKPWGFLRVTPR